MKMNSIYESTFPKGPIQRDIWIVCEARRRGTVEHLRDYLVCRYKNRTIEAGPEASTTSTEETQLLPGVATAGKRDYDRMVAYDSLKTDLVILRGILEDMTIVHKSLFNSTHVLAWTLCFLLRQVDMPSKAHWLKGVLLLFLSASGIYWSCYIPSWWCLQKCKEVVDRLTRGLEDDTLREEDNDSLNGWHWGALEWCPRFW